LEGARALLEDTHHSLDVIAQMSGFADRQRMRRAFLRTYKQSPYGIRKSVPSPKAGRRLQRPVRTTRPEPADPINSDPIHVTARQ
jgi:AraC-like DNA-binding protein